MRVIFRQLELICECGIDLT